MATILNAHLAVTPDRLHDQATILVRCDVAFTEFEVNAMNILGVRYSLRCDLLDLGALYDHHLISFDSQTFPRLALAASRVEHAEFQVLPAMHDLRLRVFGKDRLEAQLTLTNEDTGASTTARSQAVSVDLAA